MPRYFENGNGDFGPEAFRAIHCAQLSTKWSSGFMVLDVSYSRVLGQRPTFYCPLGFFNEKQAIRRRQFAAIDCDVFMCGSYRIASSELPRGLGAYVSPYLYSAINVQCSYEKTK